MQHKLYLFLLQNILLLLKFIKVDLGKINYYIHIQILERKKY